MRLLVSVADAIDAAAALEGGADVVDAKDPHAGALGAVPLPVFRAIHARVGGARPVSAALGGAIDEASIAEESRAYAEAGAAFVKVGFHPEAGEDRIERLLAAAVRGATPGCTVVAVAYADVDGAAALMPAIAARAGARGVLLDTSDKRGPGLCWLLSPAQLRAWVRSANAEGVFVALAGKLDVGDLPEIASIGADIAGVRSAACDGGRTGRVTAERVRRCRAACAIFSTQEAT
jgi:uncharacterized protein (UPF0264 family)